MRLATWNVNSINARLPTVKEVLAQIDCDVICLQEIKCETPKFPKEEIEDLGYNCAILGQKSYNGVAILSKLPIEEVETGLAGDDEDDQARYIEAVISGEKGPFRACGLYLPNGNPAPGEKFDYKLGWMERLIARAEALMALEEPFIMAGDYNVIPRDDDCWDVKAWAGDALIDPKSRNLFRQLINLGLTECFMAEDARTHLYTFWDYQAGCWPKDHGIRIDHLLASPEAADQLKAVEIFKSARGMTKPSDHVPVIGSFDL